MQGRWQPLAKWLVLFMALIGVLTTCFQFAKADVQSGWLSTADPLLSKTADLPPNVLPSFSNRDCVNETYTATNLSTGLHSTASDCFADSAIGQMTLGGSPFLFKNASTGYTLNSYLFGHWPVAPIPNQSKILAMSSAPIVGMYVHFYSNLGQHLDQNTAFPLGPTTSYTVNAAPDIDLKDGNGQLIPMNTATMSFSNNGQWMVFDAPWRGLLRLNLETMQITPFMYSLNAVNDYSTPAALTAISDDGKYAAVASDSYSFFKVYDLSTCTGTIKPDYSQSLNCQSKDYWPILAGKLNSFHALYRVRFLNDDNVAVTATVNYHMTSSSSFDVASYTLTAPGKSQHSIDYLALGDSYVSGQGEFLYKDGTDTAINTCHLSPLAYPFSIGQASVHSYQSVACSGAVTDDVIEEKLDYKGQVKDGIPQSQRNSIDILSSYMPGMLDQLAFVKQYQPSVVTLSVGGDNIGFADIVKSCVEPTLGTPSTIAGSLTCYDSYDERMQLVKAIDTAYGDLVDTYTKIIAADPGVRLYVTGYPQVVTQGDCADNVHLNSDEITFAERLIDYLNFAVQRAADTTGARYVDISAALNGHRLCETNSANVAMNGVTAGNDAGALGIKFIGAESFHPNTLGHQLIGQAVLRQTSNLSQSIPVANTSLLAPNPGDPLAQVLLNQFTPSGNPPPAIAMASRDLSADLLYRNVATTISADAVSSGLQPNGSYSIILHSSPLPLATVTADAGGGINAPITIPASVPAGFHTLHLTGLNRAGETIDYYKTIYVAASATDLDGDGILNASDRCLIMPLSGRDVDQDGIDDACDPVIGDAPSNPYPFRASLTGNSIQVTQ